MTEQRDERTKWRDEENEVNKETMDNDGAVYRGPGPANL